MVHCTAIYTIDYLTVHKQDNINIKKIRNKKIHSQKSLHSPKGFYNSPIIKEKLPGITDKLLLFYLSFFR